jgi:hypothetical protein
MNDIVIVVTSIAVVLRISRWAIEELTDAIFG